MLWAGMLADVALGKISHLLPQDVKSRPGALPALICHHHRGVGRSPQLNRGRLGGWLAASLCWVVLCRRAGAARRC